MEKTVVVMHNAVFDAYILKEQYGQLTAMIADTMLMARGLFGLEESGSLQNLAEKFHLPAKMDLNFSKGKHELSPVDFAQLRTYAINDVVLTGTLYDRMLPKMSETIFLTSVLPSFVFVCPSYCGSGCLTEMTTTIPSLQSSRERLLSLFFNSLAFLA